LGIQNLSAKQTNYSVGMQPEVVVGCLAGSGPDRQTHSSQDLWSTAS